jgi:hypothetical protein
MSDQPSDNRATNAQTVSLPDPVLAVISLPGIEPARFAEVIEAFGPLPIDGQVELANRLIGARGQYLVHRMWVCDSESRQAVQRRRLEEIGTAADRLLQLLHRDGADLQPWNLHPAVTLALPQLCRTASEHRTNQVWDPPQGPSLLGTMLADLVEVGTQAETSFQARFPKNHGGRRREGPNPATGLVEQLIEIYGAMRARYPESGPVLAFDARLKQFVRAGLAFTVNPAPEFADSDERRYRSFEARLLETDLPKTSRITDNAIRGIFNRRRTRTKVK